jgi:Ca2+/Na+ antiporter
LNEIDKTASVISSTLRESVTGSSFSDSLRKFAKDLGIKGLANCTAKTISINPVHVDKKYSGPTETSSSDSDSGNVILTAGAISGITVACILLCAIFLFVYFYLYRQKSKEEQKEEDKLSNNGDILIDYSDAHPMTEGSVSVVDDISETVRDSLTKYTLRTSFFGVDSDDVRQSINPYGRNSMMSGGSGNGEGNGGGNALTRFFSSNTESLKAATSGVISSVQKYMRHEKLSTNVDPTTAKRKETIVRGKSDNVMSLSFDGSTKPFDSLTTDELCKLLNKIGYIGMYTSQFIENGVNGSMLCEVTSPEDLKDCSIYLPGPVARSLLSSIQGFKEKGVPVSFLL